MSRSNRYSPELRERVVRIVFDRGEDNTTECATVTAISTLFGMSLEALGGWVRRAQVDQGARPGLTTEEQGRLNALELEVKDHVAKRTPSRRTRRRRQLRELSETPRRKVVEFNRGDRRAGRANGKSDTLVARPPSGFRPGKVDDPIAASEHSLRALARRGEFLNAEVRDHDVVIASLTTSLSPTLCDAFGIGPNTAAEILIVFGDNPDRVHSEARFAGIIGHDDSSSPRREWPPPGQRRDLSHGHSPHATPPADQGPRGETDERRTLQS